MQQKNVSIEAFRFFFMLILCLWHMERGIHFQYHGYLVVEFFFMLSGILLYRSYFYHPEVGVLDYSIKKIKRFWVEYAIAMITSYIMYHRGLYRLAGEQTSTIIDGIINFVLQFFSDLLMIRGGVFPPWGNSPTWYISVLLICGGLLFALLKYNPRKTITIVLPLSVLLIYGYTFPTTNSSIEFLSKVNGLYIPLIRGFADMGMGMLIGYIYFTRNAAILRYSTLINWGSLLSLFGFLILILMKPTRDAYMLIFLPIFLIGLITQDSWWNRLFKSKIWLFLGGLTYEMLLVHMTIRAPFVYFNIHEKIPVWLLGVIYISLVIVFSYLLKVVGKRIRLHFGWA